MMNVKELRQILEDYSDDQQVTIVYRHEKSTVLESVSFESDNDGPSLYTESMAQHMAEQHIQGAVTLTINTGQDTS